MRNFILLLLLVGCATSVPSEHSSVDAAEAVKRGENAFARSFAERDRTRFASLLASDATFFVRGKAVTGRDEVLKAWEPLFADAEPPFSWESQTVTVKPTGDLAISVGPVRDPSGKEVARFTSVWQKQSDGSWLVIFDGPGCDVCPAK